MVILVRCDWPDECDVNLRTAVKEKGPPPVWFRGGFPRPRVVGWNPH